ncbi:MAG: DNA-3-methyladenine glycosylase 2 family protein [Oscillospiraceae bacterium]|nr:DNA-3-methyladenine glycosylase 2 family protein [Oscillospiraceae bacterium]
MDYDIKHNNIILHEPHMSLDDTLDCGQAFRWEAVPSEYYRTYKGFFMNSPLTISEQEKDSGIFILHDTDEQAFLNIWLDYFDLNTDYGELKRRFSEDKTLSEACSYAKGVRLLRQNAEECLISFILSQNNNIPRIKGIISRLCEMYSGFPSFEQLENITADMLSPLRAGFRAKYIEDCVTRVNTGLLDIDKIKQMPTPDAQKELMTVKGIGPKVAMCVLLFGMYKTDAYPVDVWIKRVNEQYYPNGLPSCTKGVEGIAQQYLFHYIRTSGAAVK